MTAIAYVRVSTEEQALEGISLENQEASVKFGVTDALTIETSTPRIHFGPKW
jgi:hypothetical protein